MVSSILVRAINLAGLQYQYATRGVSTTCHKCSNTYNKCRWHHVLKSKFLEGKQNRCVDYLLYVLLDLVIPYYIAWSQCQEFGFEGPDLEIKKRKEIMERALTITK